MSAVASTEAPSEPEMLQESWLSLDSKRCDSVSVKITCRDDIYAVACNYSKSYIIKM